jgi:hypothetical protein
MEMRKKGNEMPENIYEKHSFLSDKIRENYAKKNDGPKFLEAAIKACKEQIAMSKEVSKVLLEGEKRFTLKSDGEIIFDFKEEMAEELAIFSGHSVTVKNKIPEDKDRGMKLPEGFDSNIHKSPDDFVIIPSKLGIHTGYNQLCIICEKRGNWQEVVRLAEQAKAEGWVGNWDKRIEKARKKLKG